MTPDTAFPIGQVVDQAVPAPLVVAHDQVWGKSKEDGDLCVFRIRDCRAGQPPTLQMLATADLLVHAYNNLGDLRGQLGMAVGLMSNFVQGGRVTVPPSDHFVWNGIMQLLPQMIETLNRTAKVQVPHGGVAARS